MRIINVVGARPNLMKIGPIMAEMHRFPDMKPILVHTGQHYDANMSGVFFQELGIPKPDYNLGVGSGSQTWQTAQIMLALEPLFQELRPDLVLVVGDVNSTLAATLVASKLGIPLAHVEAGLRSFDRTMPEEVNRILTDSVSDYLFTTEPSANENLRAEGIPEHKIFFVGNVMIDTLLGQHERAKALDMQSRYGVQPNGYALLTLHRPGNVDVSEIFKGILDSIEFLQARLPILFPAHPRTLKRLKEFGLWERVQTMSNLKILEPLSYLQFLGLMTQARLMVTDSGGVQEETTILGVPCLTLRENTERPVTVTQGTNQILGTSPKRIISAIGQVLNSEVKVGSHPELWDGSAAKRIVSIVREELAKVDVSNHATN